MKYSITLCMSITCLAVPFFSFATVTSSQQATVDTAADKIVMIMEKQNISMSSFMTILDTFEDRLQGQEMKLMVLDALKESTLDAYYQIDNFSMCQSYNDGCNTCVITEDYQTACTKMACAELGTPTCLQYEGEDMNGQDPVSVQEVACQNEGGQFNRLYNECEGIDENTCTELGGDFNECASACRHEAEGSICTMQCVVICDFNTDDMMGEEMTGVKTWEVAPYKAECTGVAPMMCLQVKEVPFGEEFTYFYDTIEGFDFQEGNKYEIEVEVTEVENPPADGSMYRYTLVNTLREQAITDHTETQMALDAAISRWNAQDMMSYTITQKLSCFCTPEYTRPIMYMVSDGKMASDAVYADEDQEMVDPDNSPELLTIEGAFDLIQEAIDMYAASITVEYDETLGYPMTISIDYDEMMADEEAYYTFEVKK